MPETGEDVFSPTFFSLYWFSNLLPQTRQTALMSPFSLPDSENYKKISI